MTGGIATPLCALNPTLQGRVQCLHTQFSGAPTVGGVDEGHSRRRPPRGGPRPLHGVLTQGNAHCRLSGLRPEAESRR